MRTMFKSLMVLGFSLAGIDAAHAAATVPMGVVPSFTEETASAGVDSTFTGDWKYIVGGGVATFDCNGDGFPDMLLAGGEHPAKFYVNQSTRGGVLMFKQEASGLELPQVVGAYPLDIDSDGVMDLVLLRSGESVAMRGLGACKFERANEKWHFTGGDLWWTAFSARLFRVPMTASFSSNTGNRNRSFSTTAG